MLDTQKGMLSINALRQMARNTVRLVLGPSPFCPCCGWPREPSDYYPDDSHPSGYRRKCKYCEKQAVRDRRRRKREATNQS